MKLVKIFSLFVCLLCLPPVALAQGPPPNGEIVPGEIIVRYEPGAAPGLGAFDNQLTETLSQSGLLVVEVPPGSEDETIANLQQLDTVAYATYNYRVHAFIEPDDPGFNSQWGLAGDNAFSLAAELGWDIEIGTEAVTVAVIDSGVDLDHPDLINKLVDGFNFLAPAQPPTDEYSHGTHVSGIIGAETDNGLGVAGTSWGAKIMPLKVLDQSGNGDTADVAEAIYYAVDNGADIINMSLGSSSTTYPCGWTAVEEALNYAEAAGVLIVAAAGNGGRYGVACPSAYDQAISVGSIMQNGGRSSFSNYGPRLDVVAPGSSIYSTLPNDSYGYKSGTSMATPYVSGLAALIWSFQPDLTAEAVRAIIETEVDDLGSPGWDDFYGHGAVDARQSLAVLSLNVSPAQIMVNDSPVVVQVGLTDPDLSVSWQAVLSPSVGWLSIEPPGSGLISSTSTTTTLTLTPLLSEAQATQALTTTVIITGTLPSGTEVGPATATVRRTQFQLYMPTILK